MIGLWNFVLTGEIRSGTSVVMSALINQGNVACHTNLFHKDASVRKAAHESYFGNADTEGVDYAPEWRADGLMSPWQYLEHFVFPTAKRNESAVGLHVLFHDMQRLELYDMLTRQYLLGNFSVVQVIRNPVACFISLKQAERSGVWVRSWRDENREPPRPIIVSTEELTQFCRTHAAIASRIKDACPDSLNITYRDLTENFQETMASVFEFLELIPTGKVARTSHKRLRNRPMTERVTNWAVVRAEVPTDVRRFIDADDMF